MIMAGHWKRLLFVVNVRLGVRLAINFFDFYAAYLMNWNLGEMGLIEITNY